MHEARDGARVAIARRQDDGSRTSVSELRSVQRIGEERDRVGRGTSQRADAIDDDVCVADELTPELRRELP
jgi:hypothetical protein